MHVVIMGCGRVGSGLAAALERRGHTVAIIDVNPDSFRRLGPQFKGITVKGVGFDRDVLTKAKIQQAGGFAAVSSGDNSNILAARVVRETYGLDNVVCRIYDQGRAEVYERLGIATVATVRWASNQVLRKLLPEGSEPLWRDSSGHVRLMEMAVHPGWIGHTISELQNASSTPIPFLQRYGQGMVPTPSTLFQDGDLAYVAVDHERAEEVEAILAEAPTPGH